MPMMRRGPLDRYPVEWVLRQASAHQSSGSIEFNAPRPITVFLHGGRIHHAQRGIPAAGEALATPATTDEAVARAQVVDVIATALGSTGGWYYHDPLGHHDERGPWQWDTAALLMDARVRSHGEDSLGRWSTAEVALHLPPTPVPVTLQPDAWAVVVALAEAAATPELRSRLGWTSERLVTALDDLASSGALRPDRRTPDARTPAAATPPAASAPPRPPAAPRPPVREGSERTAPGPIPTPRPRLAAPADRRRHPDPVADPAAAAAAIEAAESVLAQAGVSVAAPAVASPSAPPRGVAALGAADPRQATQLGGRHTGPLTPPPVLPDPADDRRSALRRLISSLRPT